MNEREGRGRQRHDAIAGRWPVRPLVLALAAAIALLAAGCSDGGGPGGAYDGGSVGTLSKEQQRINYEETMDRMRQTLEDPQAPPLEMSISTGNVRQLQAASLRWDQATSIAKSADAPSAIKQAHADLVKAMAGLGDWNRRIAKAAPNKKRTNALAKAARASADAKAFRTAVNRIEAQGYHVMTSPEEADPFAEAGPPN